MHAASAACWLLRDATSFSTKASAIAELPTPCTSWWLCKTSVQMIVRPTLGMTANKARKLEDFSDLLQRSRQEPPFQLILNSDMEVCCAAENLPVARLGSASARHVHAPASFWCPPRTAAGTVPFGACPDLLCRPAPLSASYSASAAAAQCSWRPYQSRSRAFQPPCQLRAAPQPSHRIMTEVRGGVLDAALRNDSLLLECAANVSHDC